MKGWDVVLPGRDYVGMAKVAKHMPDYQQKIEEFRKLSQAMRDDAVYGLSLLEQLENDKVLVIYDGAPCDLYAYANVDERLDKRWFSHFLIEASEQIGYDAVFQLLSYVNMNREDQHETILSGKKLIYFFRQRGHIKAPLLIEHSKGLQPPAMLLCDSLIRTPVPVCDQYAVSRGRII